jgi:hypothetical protein
MGITINWKAFSICTIIFATAISSSAQKKVQSEKEIYIEEFKFRYYEGCLKYGFNNSAEINKLLKEDQSGFSELILGDRYIVIDSLARVAGAKMQADSASSVGKRAEGAQGKRVFSTCLSSYESKWLDSLARDAYKKQQ